MVIQIIISIVGIYGLCGLLFAIPFVIKGVTAVDDGARGSKWSFRLIIMPACIVFWPLLLLKWIKSKESND